MQRQKKEVLVSGNQKPLPSGMPSPEFGAGPSPVGSSGRMYWLPDGIPSPESGAGPGLSGSSAAATIPQTMLAQTSNKIAIQTVFLILSNLYIALYDMCRNLI
jgi:hypothetical protein